jgi:hypothetical protein
MSQDIERYTGNYYSVIPRFEPHIDSINSNLIQQFKLEDHENIEKLMKITANEFEEISTDIQDLQTKVWLDTAEGAQLDMLGDLLGRQRETSQSDDDYRHDLITQILYITSEADLERVLCILSRETNNDDNITNKDIQVISSGHGTSTIYFKEITDIERLTSSGEYVAGVKACDDLLAAGVGADVKVLDENCIYSFGFADDDDNADETDAGFGADDENENDDSGCMYGYLDGNDPNLDIPLLFTLDADGDGGGFGSDFESSNSESGAFWASFQGRHDPCEISNPYVTKS